MRAETGLNGPVPPQGPEPGTEKTVRDISYHETFGMPVHLAHDGIEYRYEYYANGQLKSRASRDATVSFVYAADKVSEVETVINDEYGKQIRRSRSEFGYDAKGNLIKAGNSEGVKLSLEYNAAGLITSLRDNNRHVLSIQYDPRCGKPSVVSEKREGSMRVIYNEACGIDKAVSVKGPYIAMRVASLFNNLLNVISPVTMELYE